jgi:flagellar hook assembly protein FlgD
MLFFEPTTVGTKNGYIVFTHNAASVKDSVAVSGTADPATSVGAGRSVPDQFAVHQNYPNPFNPSTSIAFDLPERSAVRVEIYSILGNLVSTVYSGTMGAGTHSVQWNASTQSSGMYFYRVTANNQTFTRKMMLLK